jgi:hypothetical protein
MWMQWTRFEHRVCDVQPRLYFEQKMVRGQKYRVVRPFPDFKYETDPSRKEWFFAGCSYSVYDGILNVFVESDGGQQLCMVLNDREDTDTQENFKQHVERIEGQFRMDLFATARCVECMQPLDISRPDWCPSCHLVWSPA